MRRAVLQACCIGFLAIAVGFTVNHLRSDPLPLTGDWSPEGRLAKNMAITLEEARGFCDSRSAIKPVFPAISALGMYAVFFISMSAEAHTLVRHPEYLLIIALPLITLYAILFCTAVLCSRLGRMNYADMVALTYGVGGKNIPLLWHWRFFSPLTVTIIAIKPLIQVLFMAGFYRFSRRIKGVWEGTVNGGSKADNALTTVGEPVNTGSAKGQI
ncbi:MAG: hypothetical protein PHS17_07400 [Desulfobacterales bacterium]|nr:hypothetical protein [Desulfobacterales bacterium]